VKVRSSANRNTKYRHVHAFMKMHLNFCPFLITNPVRDWSKAANLAASLQSSLFKLTSFMFLSSVADAGSNPNKRAIALGE